MRECGGQCFGTRQTSFLSTGRCTASWLLLSDNLRIPAVICLSLLLTEWVAAANTGRTATSAPFIPSQQNSSQLVPAGVQQWSALTFQLLPATCRLPRLCLCSQSLHCRQAHTTAASFVSCKFQTFTFILLDIHHLGHFPFSFLSSSFVGQEPIS